MSPLSQSATPTLPWNQRYVLDHQSTASTANIHPEDEPQETSTNSELVEQLEVIFESDQSHRRRSSLNTIPSRPSLAHRKTSCFVHGFLKDEQLNRHETGQQVDRKADPHTSDKDPHGHGSAGGSIQSRLLSKKELSDMAFSIRELSKRLGRFKLKLNVKNVFLLTKAHDPTLMKYTREVAEWLLSPDSGGPYTV